MILIRGHPYRSCFQHWWLYNVIEGHATAPSIALSTTGVEHMAIAKAIKEAIWLPRFLGKLLIEQHSPHLCCDYWSAIFLEKDQKYHERAKNIDILYHYVHDVFVDGDVVPEKIGCHNNVVDKSKASTLPQFDPTSSLESFCWAKVTRPRWRFFILFRSLPFFVLLWGLSHMKPTSCPIIMRVSC